MLSHKFIKAGSLLLCLFYLLPVKAQTKIPGTLKAFESITGSWEGSLTYLDYSTNKPYTMAANLIIQQLRNTDTFLFKNSYPKEPGANSVDTLIVSGDGRMINSAQITSKSRLEDGKLEMMSEHLATDGNQGKPALIKMTYVIGKKVYILRKEIQFFRKTEWIKRHEYSYHRETKSN